MSRRPLPEPRWQTPLPRQVVGSWGPDVTAWAEANLGIRHDRWQRRALNRALAFDANGRLVHSMYLISVGRQNGKTALVRSLIGWALTARATPPWTTIIGLANDRKQARLPYEAVLLDLAPMARRLGPPARGGLALTRYLGIRSGMYGRHRTYDIASREARDSIRGTSNDLSLFDEVRTQRDRLTWDALEPTTRARPMPLVIPTSSAGDDRSLLLREWWERGIRIIDGVEPAAGFGMTWYAAGDDQAPDDPAAIRAANPAVAEGRIPLEIVRRSIYSLAPAGYRAETLNLWSAGEDEWLPAGIWRVSTAPQPDHTGVRVVLAVEAVPSWRRASVVVGIETDVCAWLGLAGELDSDRLGVSSVPPAQLQAMVARLAGAWKPAAITYSAAAAAEHFAEAAAAELRIPTIALGPRQVRAASGLLRSELVGGRLTHEDDQLLAQQVRAARPSAPIEGGDWYFSVRESVGEIDALRAVAWAAFGVVSPPEREVRPQVFA